MRLLAQAGAKVRVASRDLKRAQATCDAVSKRVNGAQLTAWQAGNPAEAAAALDGTGLVIAAGPPAAQLLTADAWHKSKSLSVAIDLNAVPPTGIEGIKVSDKAEQHGSVVTYGAIGVGGLKIQIHKAAVRQLFVRNDQVFDAEAIFQIGHGLTG